MNNFSKSLCQFFLSNKQIKLKFIVCIVKKFL